MNLNADNLADISERMVSEAVRAGADDVIVSGISSDTRQIRFSENRIDIFNNWKDTSFHLFLVRQKRVVATTIKGNDDYREANTTVAHIIFEKYVLSTNIGGISVIVHDCACTLRQRKLPVPLHPWPIRPL